MRTILTGENHGFSSAQYSSTPHFSTLCLSVKVVIFASIDAPPVNGGPKNHCSSRSTQSRDERKSRRFYDTEKIRHGDTIE